MTARNSSNVVTLRIEFENIRHVGRTRTRPLARRPSADVVMPSEFVGVVVATAGRFICHAFAVDEQLREHGRAVHGRYAAKMRMPCARTGTPVGTNCAVFSITRLHACLRARTLGGRPATIGRLPALDITPIVYPSGACRATTTLR